MASEIEQVTSLGENGGGEDSTLMEQAAIERRNLLNIVKLTVKVLIESAMRKGQPMDDSNSNLQQLFTAIEHSLRHRLKGKLTTERTAMHTQTYNRKYLLGNFPKIIVAFAKTYHSLPVLINKPIIRGMIAIRPCTVYVHGRIKVFKNTQML